MSRFVIVTAAIVVPKPRLQAYLRAPVAPASTWTEQDWAGLCEPWSDSGTRRRYRRELAGAVAECDGWIDGDYAGLLCGLDGDGEPAIRFDEATGSLTVDFDCRVDFQLPSMIWAFTALRGMAGFMAEDDSGLVAVTADWSDETVLMHLSPGRSSFLDPNRDTAALARARDAAFDARCAAGDADTNESATEVVERLLRP
ncbi:hypothetical protein [Kitasatospora sp. KL5]|uniref:hypothetical protein n=1 Tax=Kitasatospora sp. KL5 TaxID=3425125 RepID=UPI003D6DAED5